MKTLIARRIRQCMLQAAIVLIGSSGANSQNPPPAWDAAKYFKYNIENILVNKTGPATWNVKVIFSVTNPRPDSTVSNNTWNIKAAAPYQSVGAGLTMDIGWDGGTDFTNTGSANASLTPVVPSPATLLGTGAALPIQVRGLNSVATGAKPCLFSDCPGVPVVTDRFYIERSVTPVTFMKPATTGRIGMEGHPVCNGLPGCPAGPPYANIPVRSEVASFSFLTATTPTQAVIADPRLPIVDFDSKCNVCHNGTVVSGSGTLIPRLSLHGNNRNENLALCVMCHNPNQTDVPFRVNTADPRTSGPETALDFKRMVHSIHAGGFRATPFVVIGFNTSINDYSGVRFPRSLRNCVNCHVDSNGRGTFELPIRSTALGTTVTTGSTYAVPLGASRTIDVNPFNDLKITPTAAACSGRHDRAEVQSHMVRTGGASFSTLQANIGVTVNERCPSCHGPGKEEDVRKAHEISSGRLGRDRDRH